MRASIIVATLVLCSLPGIGAAQSFDGAYAVDDCQMPHDGVMTLAGATITFYESACRLSNPGPLAGFDEAVLYDAACAGEGETWREKMLIMPALSGGLVVVTPGWANVYERCQ